MSVTRSDFSLQQHAIELELPFRVSFAQGRLQALSGKNDEILSERVTDQFLPFRHIRSRIALYVAFALLAPSLVVASTRRPIPG
jgi:hypothetical protein